ncbi:MFS transporter [Jatrophihabitans endophyticus]|uniref:MFS transporter n=1 Tax=Jatrophihabitans endophyticus TaxID=1206085 RepID=UPI001A08AD1B|nr:MFS transporter [Jatrophihabitans endophyticus]MBE7186892.1 MFS transporter [Jatrophihabitans endophyticus]
MTGRLATRLPGGATVVALAFVMGLDAGDQASIGSTAPEVRAAFGIGSTQIGLLATASTVVGVVLTLPFGVLADRANRIGLLRNVVLLWTVAMIGVGAAPGYGWMLAGQCVVGIVTGAGGPLIASLVGDLVPRVQRGRVYSTLLIGELAGAALGTGLAGEVAAVANWRVAFWLLAVLGLVTFGFLTRAPEPERIGTPAPRRRPLTSRRGAPPPGGDPAVMPLGQALLVLVRIPTNVILVVASSLGYFYFTGVQTFGVSLLIEDYGVAKGVAPLLVLLVGASLAVGVLIGGPIGDRLTQRGVRLGRLYTVLVAFVGSTAFIVPALSLTDIWATMPLLITAGVLLGSANPPLDASRIDIVPHWLLGRAEAVRTALRDGADATAPVVFGAVGAARGLRPTFLLMTIALGAAAGLGLGALRTYSADAGRVERDERADPAASSV